MLHRFFARWKRAARFLWVLAAAGLAFGTTRAVFVDSQRASARFQAGTWDAPIPPPEDLLRAAIPICIHPIEFWQSNPEAWPAQQFLIGGQEYTQEQLLNFLQNGPPQTGSQQLLYYLLPFLLDNIEPGLQAEADQWLSKYGTLETPDDLHEAERIRLAVQLKTLYEELLSNSACRLEEPEAPAPTEPLETAVQETAEVLPETSEPPSATPIPSPIPPQCTHSSEYWSQNPEAWPVKLLTLGGKDYQQAELLAVLFFYLQEESGLQDGLFLLPHLITARLNLLNGAYSAEGGEAAAAAEAWLELHQEEWIASPQTQEEQSALVEQLDAYNSGSSGPESCEEFLPTETPIPTLPVLPEDTPEPEQTALPTDAALETEPPPAPSTVPSIPPTPAETLSPAEPSETIPPEPAEEEPEEPSTPGPTVSPLPTEPSPEAGEPTPEEQPTPAAPGPSQETPPGDS